MRSASVHQRSSVERHEPVREAAQRNPDGFARLAGAAPARRIGWTEIRRSTGVRTVRCSKARRAAVRFVPADLPVLRDGSR